MPNHIQNVITITGDQTEIDKLLINIQRPFDSDDYRGETEGCYYFTFAKIIAPPDTEDYKKDGWYNWNVAHWGTKWDAYSQNNDGNILKFQTAWSHPMPIINKLSELYPSLTFIVEYADEDTSSDNYDKYELTDGEQEDLSDDIDEIGSEQWMTELHGMVYESCPSCGVACVHCLAAKG